MKGIIFDLDYTLIDASEGIVDCVRYALSEMNISVPEETTISGTIGLSFENTFKKIAPQENVTRWNEFKVFFLSQAQKVLTKKTKILPNVIEILSSLKKNGIKLGLCTSKFRREVDELLKKPEFSGIFDFTICGDEVKAEKPNPEGLLNILKKMGFENNDVTYIGDHPVDLQAAKSANIKFIAVLTGNTKKEVFISQGAQTIINSLSELGGIFSFLQKDARQNPPLTYSLSNSSNISNYKKNELQLRIHIAIQKVGGYWEPLAAVARLLEELGEASDVLITNEIEKLGDELADVYIISTCLANQYCAFLNQNIEKDCTRFEEIISISGQIARTVNFYEGPKKPKVGEKLDKIESLIEKLHKMLFSFSTKKSIDLEKHVVKKVDLIESRDLGRFSKSYDPSTSITLDLFSKIKDNSLYPYEKQTKIWSTPEWNNLITIEENVRATLKQLIRFSKIGESEGLDLFVLAAPSEKYGSTPDHLGEFVRRVLLCLDENDPSNSQSIRKGPAHILSNGWNFEFNNLKFSISAFSPCYSQDNARKTFGIDSIFIVFQPNYPSSPNTRNFLVRKQFEKYTESDGLSQLEAYKVVKPFREKEKMAISWWEPKVELLKDKNITHDISKFSEVK